MSVATPELQSTTSPLRAVPRAVWVVVGGLSILTAGLAGALVSRWVAPATPAPAAQVATASQPQQAATPAQAAQLQGSQPAQPATQQPAPVVAQQHSPAPVHPSRPAPAHHAQPAPVQTAQGPQQQWTPVETTRAAVCASCGTVESMQAVQQKGEGSGLGAIAGGVVGGLLGNQVGGGNGKTAMTVIGAVGGGFAGNEVEKRARATTAYDVRVRMEDGSVRSFRRAEPVAVGTRVVVEGNGLRVANDRYGSGSGGGEPRTLRTSAPAGAGV